ncbi:helix-turn-helix domain-containing protein [Methylobacterium trifolii]|uniref:XRE family transcriptional regulator n=1 Tax=Methylobacterium trifolii TaxID=1003092 RepID=A0ABQ4U2I9_9HYPH|nr:XRE family transcriptional regulator [Methylobacterium trifolii]GJE61675.1 hypothetical protein MPOCJGCO_3798 [Methylobacterium trifolii]
MAGSDEGTASGLAQGAMTPAQSRAARGLLDWSAEDLAGKVGLEPGFVRAFEGGHGDPPSGQVEALRSALMAAGIVFTDAPSPGVSLDPQGGGGEGTRLDALTTENDR